MRGIRMTVASAMAAVCIAVVAEGGKSGGPVTSGRMTREEFMRMSPAEREAFKYRMTGGMLQSPGSRKGRVAFLNAQRDLPAEEIRKVAALLHNDFKGYDIVVMDVPPMPVGAGVAEFARAKGESGANIAVVVVSNDTTPVILSAPDDDWASVNVKAMAKGLATQQARDKFYYGRCRKELLRGFAAAAGGLSSIYDKNVMNVTSVADLDFVDEFLPHDKVKCALHRFKVLGMEPVKMTTYLKACKEGWAPSPTNDVQKAIFEQVKADKERGPTNPITIQPPNQKK